MKKVLVIGSGGAGKTTFSKRLGQELGIEVVHLDEIYWKPGWEKTPADEWAEIVRGQTERESWVMDGNFGGTRVTRIRASDTVIFLDIPRLVCLYRVLKRGWQYRGKTRPDMARGCIEKIDMKFISWIWNYPKTSRQLLIEELRSFPEKDLIVLRSSREIEAFLRTI